MISSTRCSGRRALRALAAATLLVATACGHGAPTPGGLPRGGFATGERPRVVLLPLENLSGGPSPPKELMVSLEVELRRRVDVVAGDALEQFLARHRIRYTGGLDAEAARAAREELDADAVLVTSLEQYRPSAPPAVSIAMRLVSTGEQPVILWLDAVSRSGDDSPGLLQLGVIDTMKPLLDRVLAELTGSFDAFVEGKGGRAPGCGGAWHGPRVRFRSSLLDERAGSTLAVLPFLNRSQRRGAGDAVSLEFVRHLVATGAFRVLEPGVVRDYLLRSRMMIPGGASLETARLMLGALEVDRVLSGVVLDYDETPGTPLVRFTATMLDGETGEVVWQSTSYNRGDDGVFAFGLGRVRTASGLTCRMVGDVVRALPQRTGTVSRPPHRDDEGRRGELPRRWPESTVDAASPGQ